MMDLNILYEDNHLIAVEKKPGILTQQDYRGEPSLMDHVKDYLKKKYHKQGDVFLGIVHRLDRPVSGIILFARTSKAASRLSAQFRNGETEKFYLALTTPVIKHSHEGWISLRDSLSRNRDVTVIDKADGKHSKEALLDYRLIETYRSLELLLIRLITGKKHQIRAQLSSRGMHIIGDTRYGSPEKLPGEHILLHSSRLNIIHPTRGDRITLKCPVHPFFSTYITLNNNIEEIVDKMVFKYMSK